MKLTVKFGLFINVFASLFLIAGAYLSFDKSIIIGASLLVISSLIIAIKYDGPTLMEEIKNHN
jgi:hypothetical protein